MADPQTNPFSGYSLDDQNVVADQLRTAQGSGKLNPAQVQGVASALKYLPQSKTASLSQVNATTGAGKLAPSPGNSFADTLFSGSGSQKFKNTNYVDPQSPIFGGDLGAPHADLVDISHVASARKDIKYRDALSLRQHSPGGELYGHGDPEGDAISPVLSDIHDSISNLGASVASMPFNKGSVASGVASGTGRFFTDMATDPTNYALGSIGEVGTLGRAAMGLGFAGSMGKGVVDQAGDLGSRWDTLSQSEKAEGLTSMTLNTVIAGAAGGHGLSELKPSYAPVEATASTRGSIPLSPEASSRLADVETRQNRLIADMRRGQISQGIPTTSFSGSGTKPGLSISEGSTTKLAGSKPAAASSTFQPAVDNSTFVQAKREFISKNPGVDVTTSSAMSQIAQRADQLNKGTVKVADLASPSSSSDDRGIKAPQQRTFLPTSPADVKEYYSFRRDQVASELKAAQASGDTAGAADAQRRLAEMDVVKDLHPVSTPPVADTGSKWKSVQQQKQEGTSPKQSGNSPLQRPSTDPSPTDLRSMDTDTRHDWVNKNAPVAIAGDSLATARANAIKIFGRGSEVSPYIDKDGVTRYGSKYPIAKSAETSLPSTAETAGAKESTTSTQTPGTPADVGNSETKTLEQQFISSGGQQSLLDSLRKAATSALPKDTPLSSIETSYSAAVAHLVKSFQSGDFAGMAKAFDIAKKRGEQGFLGGNRTRFTEEESRALATSHVKLMLDKWEGLSNDQLKSRSIQKKLTSDTFANAVAGSDDPLLQTRHHALLERTGHLNNPVDALSRLFGGQKLSPGDLTRGVMRESLATAARSKDMNTQALGTYIRTWDARSLSDKIGFIDSIEKGDIQGISDHQDQMLAQRLRTMLDTKRNQIQDLGTGKFDFFNENYFPHLWRFGVTDLAKQIVQGRRPLSGAGSFLKPRTYNSFAEGIEAGLEPVTYNPVQMALLKLHEMDRYLSAHTAFNELRQRGLVGAFEPKEVPDGWVKLNDNMFRAGDKSFYAPADAARPINNHLSPGLRGNAIFNSVSAYNNLFNQFNLGFSVFHGTETAVNSIASEMGLGLQKLSRGDIKGVGNVLSSPAAPLRNYLLGSKLIQEYMEPGRYSELSALASATERAGGRIAMPPEYKNAAREALRSSWKEAVEAKGASNISAAGKVAYRSAGAAMEALSIPLMEKFVPRIKLGTFAREASSLLDRLPEDTPKEVLRQELGKIWDSIDNRFGQVVYDNNFFNRTGKDLAHLMIRSVGWNLGTIREIGGGVFNLQDYSKPLTGKGLTTKQAYVLSLGAMTAGIGAIINAAYGQKPQTLDDYLYPKTSKIGPDGTPERVMLKTYIHDSMAFAHSPGQTAVNKLAPAWNQIANLYNNSDYYGNQIHPIHGSTKDALLDPRTYTDTAKYFGKSAMPFSVENYNQRRLSGESVLSSLSSSAAILPAPKWAGQTPAASLAYELYKTQMKRGPTDPDTAAHIQRYHQLATGYAANQFTSSDITAAFKAGEINSTQYDGILDEQDGKLTPLQRHVKNIAPKDLLRVWELSSGEEKQSLMETYLKKWDGVADGKYGYTPSEATQLEQSFNTQYKLFRGQKK